MIHLLVTWGPAVCWAAILFLFSSAPELPGTGLMDRIPAGDKLAHAGAYAVLGAALAWARHSASGRAASRSASGAGAADRDASSGRAFSRSASGSGASSGRAVARGGRVASHGVFLALGALYGATDEWHQSFVPGRHVSAADWLADVVGVVAGYALTWRAFAPRAPEPPPAAVPAPAPARSTTSTPEAG